MAATGPIKNDISVHHPSVDTGSTHHKIGEGEGATNRLATQSLSSSAEDLATRTGTDKPFTHTASASPPTFLSSLVEKIIYILSFIFPSLRAAPQTQAPSAPTFTQQTEPPTASSSSDAEPKEVETKSTVDNSHLVAKANGDWDALITDLKGTKGNGHFSRIERLVSEAVQRNDIPKLIAMEKDLEALRVRKPDKNLTKAIQMVHQKALELPDPDQWKHSLANPKFPQEIDGKAWTPALVGEYFAIPEKPETKNMLNELANCLTMGRGELKNDSIKKLLELASKTPSFLAQGRIFAALRRFTPTDEKSISAARQFLAKLRGHTQSADAVQSKETQPPPQPVEQAASEPVAPVASQEALDQSVLPWSEFLDQIATVLGYPHGFAVLGKIFPKDMEMVTTTEGKKVILSIKLKNEVDFVLNDTQDGLKGAKGGILHLDKEVQVTIDKEKGIISFNKGFAGRKEVKIVGQKIMASIELEELQADVEKDELRLKGTAKGPMGMRRQGEVIVSLEAFEETVLGATKK
jgi:hypothetical protein